MIEVHRNGYTVTWAAGIIFFLGSACAVVAEVIVVIFVIVTVGGFKLTLYGMFIQIV